MKVSSILFLSLSLVFWGCGEKTQQAEEMATRSASSDVGMSLVELDEAKIQNWLSDQKEGFESLPSGLYYNIEYAGSKEKPSLRSLVEVHYHGYSLEGKVFDSTIGKKPLRYPLAKLIRGWQEGIPMIGKGGKITLVIPSGLAYGDRQISSEVGPNSVLVFEIELVDFEG